MRDLVPDDGIRIRVLECDAVASGGNVSTHELVILDKLVQMSDPRVIFEIGTFDGRTTLNLAANSAKDAVIYTLDLPREQSDSTKFALGLDERGYAQIARDRVGCRFANSPYRNKVVQLWGDSATFDFSPHYGRADFVFVDGSHTYDYALNDSMIALQLLRPGTGMILWHDYDWGYGGVARVLEELCRTPEFEQLKYLEGTALACLRIPGQGDRVSEVIPIRIPKLI